MKILAGLGGILFALPSLYAEVDSEIPLGIEAVTGIRSSYVHRGFELADSSLDFQLEAEVSLSDKSSVHLGFSHLAESDGDFSETSAYLEFTHTLNQNFSVGTSLTYRDRDESVLESGFDLGFFTSYSLNDDWKWRTELNFDFGESGIYLASELEWSYIVSEKSFLAIEGGVSVVSDYFNRDGFNDLYAKITYTYALSDQVALSPFLGTSIQLDDQDADDTAYAGLWFEVIF